MFSESFFANMYISKFTVNFTFKNVKGAMSRNSAKLGNYKMTVKLRET